MSFESNIGRLANNVLFDFPETPSDQTTGFRAGESLVLRSVGTTGPIYPRSDWPELMAMQEKHRTSPFHVHADYGVPIMTQKQTNFCWMFGPVAGVMNRYANMDGVAPLLSPAAPACQGKDFANEGGWGEEAIRYIRKYGVPTQEAWPNCSFDRDLPSSEAVIDSSAKHNVIQYEMLGAYDFDAVMSALLCPYNSSPVTLGYSHWGHLVLGLQGVRYNGQWGIVFANSWDTDWGEEGYGVMLGERANPTEAVVIKTIKPRRI